MSNESDNQHRVRYWPLHDRGRTVVMSAQEGVQSIKHAWLQATKGHDTYLLSAEDLKALEKWNLSLAPGLWNKVAAILVSRGVANYTELPAPDIFAWLHCNAPKATDTAQAAALADTPANDYLTNWDDIMAALGRKNTPEERGKIARLNRQFNGPINMPKQGGQPKATRPKLLSWWNGLEEKFHAEQATRTTALERPNSKIGDALYDGNKRFGQVKANLRTTGRRQRP